MRTKITITSFIVITSSAHNFLKRLYVNRESSLPERRLPPTVMDSSKELLPERDNITTVDFCQYNNRLTLNVRRLFTFAEGKNITLAKEAYNSPKANITPE